MSNKQLLINVLVFAAGGTAGFFVAKQVYKKYYEAIANEEIESVKERFYIQTENDESPEGVNDEEACAKEAVIDTEDQDYKDFQSLQEKHGNFVSRSSLVTNRNEQAKTNYNILSNRPPEMDEEPFTDAAGKSEEEMNPKVIDKSRPYLIDDEEFCNECDHHEKVSLYYYSEDDVLCDERDEVIDNIEETVGYDALAALDMQTSCWVRNEQISIDYEICLIRKSYAEVVGGVKPVKPQILSPREKYVRDAKRREESEK